MLFTALLLAGALEAPLSLTASDGSGLKLVSLDADAVCSGPVCFTELRLAFENPQDRVIEGQFQIALPPGASVSRFAMKIDDRLQEAEVVEKKAARRAYEDFLHRRQDPALLEQAAGNQFQARVFPIPAKGRKELVVGYGHTLSSSSTYVFPLLGLPQVDQLRVRVRDGFGQALLSFDKEHFVPGADASVFVKGSRALRSEDVVVVRAAPVFDNAADVGDGGLIVLIDTSASRALQMPKDTALLTAVLKEMGKTAPTRSLLVTAFDQHTEDVYRGPIAAFDAQRLSKRRALGATDLAGALRHAVNAAKGKAFDRIVIISDGVVTAEMAGSLTDATRVLKASGVRRVDAIVRGGVRDEVALAGVVKGGQQEGLVVDGDAPVAELVRRLGRVARSGIRVDVVGATWVWPKTLDGVQPGDERVIVAELKAGAKLLLTFDGVVVDVGDAVSAPAPLLRRAWAEAKIARAQQQLTTTKSAAARQEIKDQIVTLSTRHRVLSSETSLLVLETEADYARYGIDRRALADILVVNDAGLGLITRKEVVVAVAPPKPLPKSAPESKKAKAIAAEGESEGSKFEGESDDDSADKDQDIEKEVAGKRSPAKAADEESPSSSPPPPPPPASGVAPLLRLPRPTATPSAPSGPAPRPPSAGAPAAEMREAPGPTFVNPWTGPFEAGMKLLKANQRAEALKLARAWHEEQPGDVLALLLLAEVLEADDVAEAARALGSVIDLFPQRTDLRRAVGARLDRLLAAHPSFVGAPVLANLSVDTWRHSVEQRPDHPQSHRGLAWALVRQGNYAAAFAAITNALQQKYRSDSFAGVDRILSEDLGLIAALWKAQGGPKDLDQRVQKAGGVVVKGPSLRFVLWWETDSNDVDFHIYDGQGNHAFYSQPELDSGGQLYADVTTGYGPECFTILGSKRAFPYALSAHYYSRGPMGFGLGTLMVIDHDGKGGVTFSDRPFVIMVDGAFVDLGSVTR